MKVFEVNSKLVLLEDKITYLNHYICTLTSLIFLSCFLSLSPFAVVYFSFPVKSPDMQIRFSNCETAAKKCTGLNISQHYLSLLTDFLSHSLPLHFSCNHNSTSPSSPKYSASLYHVGKNVSWNCITICSRTSHLTWLWISQESLWNNINLVVLQQTSRLNDW